MSERLRVNLKVWKAESNGRRIKGWRLKLKDWQAKIDRRLEDRMTKSWKAESKDWERLKVESEKLKVERMKIWRWQLKTRRCNVKGRLWKAEDIHDDGWWNVEVLLI